MVTENREIRLWFCIFLWSCSFDSVQSTYKR